MLFFVKGLLIVWLLCFPAWSQSPEVVLEVDPPTAELWVNQHRCPAQEGGRYPVHQEYFGQRKSDRAHLVLRCSGFAQRDLGDYSYGEVKHGKVARGPYRLSVTGLPGLFQRYPWQVLVGFSLMLAALGQVFKVARQSRGQAEKNRVLMGLTESQDFSDPLVGTPLGGYQILSRLGEGGMATVYRAVPLDRVAESEAVALKIIRPDQASREFQARFQREIRVSAKLDHPNVLRLIDWGQDSSITYLVMELVNGTTLSKLIPAGGLPLAQGMAYLGGIIEGLAYAHSRGIVHRDLKPENVMVTASGKVKLMDFGLARSREVKTVTVTGSVMGTPAYMAPEQILNGPSRDALTDRSDQYALAVLIYEVLAGRRPFEQKDPMALIMSHINEPPPCITEFRPDLPERFSHALLKMLAKSPRERFDSVKDAGRVLLQATAHLSPANTTSLQNLELLNQPAALPESDTVEVPC